MTDKKYAGNGKNITTKYGNLMKLSLTEEDVKTLQENLKEGWVNIAVKERKEPSKTGFTHYLEIDDYKKPEVAEEVKTESDPF